MKQYNVSGMSCAACSARIEKEVSKLPGVTEVSVSLLTNSMGVYGDVLDEDVIGAVVKAGYGASIKKNDGLNSHAEGGGESLAIENSEASHLEDREFKILKKRLLSSLIFWVLLMYFSMGHMMWGWPLPKWFEGNHVAMGILQLLLASIVMVINQKFFVSGFKSLVHLAPNMDTLVAIGSSASFVWSVYALFAMTDAQLNQDLTNVIMYMDEFYFESAATILTLITVGKMLEARSKGKTTDALKGLMSLAPKTATIIRDEQKITVDIKQVKKNDIFVVLPGESIPVDGIVLEGSSAINEAALTGESIPVDKEIGDYVSAATINLSGYLKCEATRVGEDTTLSQIIKMVSDAAATKAPIARIADKVSYVFVPSVILISLLTLIAWILAGQSFDFALSMSIAVLVISCPCALGLATPVAIMVGNGVGAKAGILFKTAAALEQAGKCNVVVLDKTGTITKGKPVVTDIIPAKMYSEDDLLRIAYSLEIRSEHPLAKAIVDKGSSLSLGDQSNIYEVTNFKALPGNGLSATINNENIFAGNMDFISGRVDMPEHALDKCISLANEGKTPLLFAYENDFIGIIAVSDELKEDSALAIDEIKRMGIKVMMLTGDNEKTANAIGLRAGVDEVIANVLPNEKEGVIRKLQSEGNKKVIMVGDGINDAPALTRADVGIAIGAGTDIAMDAADVVLMKNTLYDVYEAMRISRKTLRNIKQNLFWAFFYNTVGIPLAAGLFYPVWGIKLNPMFAAAAMSLSSFCVVTNALRLNLIKPSKRATYFSENDENQCDYMAIGDNQNKKNNINDKEKNEMTKTLIIEGMMCAHCEARVKKTLENIQGVESASVSHEAKTAVVNLEQDIDNEVLKKAVEEQDYKVIEIK